VGVSDTCLVNPYYLYQRNNGHVTYINTYSGICVHLVCTIDCI